MGQKAVGGYLLDELCEVFEWEGRYFGCRRLSNMKTTEGEVAPECCVTSVDRVVSIGRMF